MESNSSNNSLNNNYDKLYSILLNDDSISSQIKQNLRILSLIPQFFLLKFATMNGQTWKNMKKVEFSKFTSSNLIAH